MRGCDNANSTPLQAFFYLLTVLLLLFPVIASANTADDYRVETEKLSFYVGGENVVALLASNSTLGEPVRVKLEACGVVYIDELVYFSNYQYFSFTDKWVYVAKLSWVWEASCQDNTTINVYAKNGTLLASFEYLWSVPEPENPGHPLWRAMRAVFQKIVDGLIYVFKKVGNAILSLLPDWLENIIRGAWSIVSGFAPPLFDLVSTIFQVYPFIFMVVSLKYILTGDMEGWMNYLFMHVKIIKVFIDLGLKLIELIKP